jgi:hypothetical protein
MILCSNGQVNARSVSHGGDATRVSKERGKSGMLNDSEAYKAKTIFGFPAHGPPQ